MGALINSLIIMMMMMILQLEIGNDPRFELEDNNIRKI